MINLKEYAAYDGMGLAALVKRGEVTPDELRATALEAIECINPRLNAVLQVLGDESAEGVRSLSGGPLWGVPFLVKELMCHPKGVTFNMGSRLAQGCRFDHDTELMKRFRAAGLITVGTTQTPEFGYNPTTEPVLFGPVHNPWKLGHSAGGSSGGSAAAVAAGVVPLAHANDGGGSIRIPASCNGLVGLKPTRDRVPAGPDSADPLCGLAIEFAVTRSVRDAGALLDAVAGADVGAPGLLPAPERSFSLEVGAPPGRLRIAWSAQAPGSIAVHSDCQAAVHESVALLEELGHELVEDAPTYDWDRFLEEVHVIWAAYNASAIDGVAEVMGRSPSPENLEAVTWELYEDGKRYSAMELFRSLDHQNEVSRAVGAFFEGYDVLVTPTLARPPVPHGEIDQNRPGLSARGWTEQVFEWCPFTPLFNSTGQPAISLPLHWAADGLPVGVQFAGRFGAEATLLRLASQLEEARPWSSKRPAIHAALL